MEKEENKDLIPNTIENTIVQIQKEQIEQMNVIAQDAVEAIAQDRDRADELYDFMRDQIDIDGDKNPATREAMAKALELRMKGTDQKIELLKIKAKLINPQKDAMSVNINLGNYDEKKGSDTSEMIDIADQYRQQYSK